jgi:hypothetical protein
MMSDRASSVPAMQPRIAGSAYLEFCACCDRIGLRPAIAIKAGRPPVTQSKLFRLAVLKGPEVLVVTSLEGQTLDEAAYKCLTILRELVEEGEV